MKTVPEQCEVVVIGGGIIGCSTAYYLARMGLTDVCVVEKSYLASGSTGRCGAGVRHQWGTEMNCRLAADSIACFETLADELEYEPGIEFKQGGYLILAYSDSQWEQMKKNVELQRFLGIEVFMLTPAEAREIVPYLEVAGLIGATYCPRDGHVNPFRAVDAYARAARQLGVTIVTDTEVTGITVDEGQVVGVSTSRGEIRTRRVMNAAGPYSQIVGKMAGVEVPVFSERHQILVTEPIGQVQKPMVLSIAHGLYCQQVPGGNFLIGLGEKDELPGYDISSGWKFLMRAAVTVADILPAVARLRVIRQWAGLYNVSPDRQPILGTVPDVAGYFMAVGFSGHGFMVAPTVSESMAAVIMGKSPRFDISRLDRGRFDRGELILEPAVV